MSSYSAAYHGDILALVKSNQKERHTTYGAAYKGNFNCLRLCVQLGYPYDTLTAAYAAYGGHLDCLKYLYKIGCPWDVRTTNFAAWNKHYDCLEFAIEHGCPYDSYTIDFALKYPEKQFWPDYD